MPVVKDFRFCRENSIQFRAEAVEIDH